MKHPVSQLPSLQTACVPQLVPSAMLLHAVVLTEGWQVWQPLVGFAVPLV
jgi:hypothetical protein